MPESDLLLNAPGFILLEYIILGLLVFSMLSGAGGLWYIYLDGRRGRKALHEKIELFAENLSKEIDTKVQPVQDGIDSHIKECQDLRVEDSRWMGGVNVALKMLTDGRWSPDMVDSDN